MGELKNWVSLARLAMLCFVCTFLLYSPAEAEDSCISCHTDEEMLKQNLSKDEKKKSAMQSGPG